MLYDRPTPTMPSFVQKSGVKAGKEKVVARIIGKLVAAKHNRQLLTLEMLHHISTSPMTSNLYLCCFEKNMLSTSLLERTSFNCNFGVLKNHHDSKHPCGHEVTTRSKPWTQIFLMTWIEDEKAEEQTLQWWTGNGLRQFLEGLPSSNHRHDIGIERMSKIIATMMT